MARRRDAGRAAACVDVGPGRRANRVAPVGRQLPCRRADGRRAAGTGRGRPDGTRCVHRSRLGSHRWSRPYGDARQPVHQGRHHVGTAICGVSAAGRVPDVGRLAALLPRQLLRNSRPPAQYAELHQHWLSAPRLPTLYLHGTDDGCATPHYTPWIERVSPDGSESAIVKGAGHFLQLDQPDVVARHIVDFIGQAA